MKDIAENGLSPLERTAVIEKKDGSFICVEGNRRICALKLLNNPKLSPKSYQDDFDEISKKFDKWKEIKQLDVVKFEETDEDLKKIELWLNRTHAGPDHGRGRLPWNSEQKARHNQKHQGKFALAVLDYAEEQGFISKSKRVGRISTVRNWLSYSIMLDTFGLKARDDASLKNLSGANLIAFKQFIADVSAKKIISWTNKDKAEDYAKELINNKDVTDKDVSNESLTSTVNPTIKTSTTHTKFKKRTKIKSNPELEKALEELDIYKLQKIYYSLCKIDLQEHAPLLYVGAWSFLETLTNLFRERGNKKFSDYLDLKKITSLSIVKGNDALAIFQAVDRISKVGNTTKHNKTAAGFDGEQLANDFEEMNPLLVYLVKKAIKEKKQS